MHIDYLNIDFEFKEEDEWVLISIGEKLYDVHYCKNYNELAIYDYDPELDGVTHRFELIAIQPIFNEFEDWLHEMQVTGEYSLHSLLNFKDYYNNINSFDYNTKQFKNFINE